MYSNGMYKISIEGAAASAPCCCYTTRHVMHFASCISVTVLQGAGLHA